jgi:N-methylhydantoinase A/oxoprolinase/acetone carboxylase beta subunit
MGQRMLNPGWDELEKLAEADFKAEGLPWDQATVRQIAYVRYGSQMDDIEVPSPVSRINSAEDMDKLIAAFEDRYEIVYAGVAKHSQAGYQILELGLTATIPKVKPKLVKRPLEGKTPPREAFKGERAVFIEGRWHQTPLYDMDLVRPGNEIEGIAVIEAPSTTFFVPPGRRVNMDEWSMLWLN